MLPGAGAPSGVGSVYQTYDAASTEVSKKSSYLAYQIQIK
jgi:hypothetical protein